MRKKILMGMSLLACAAMLGACGSSNKEGATDPLAVAAKVNADQCTDMCHAIQPSKVTGLPIVAAWSTSPHANPDASGDPKVDCQACHGGGSLHRGIGPLPFGNPDASLVCATCHKLDDQTGRDISKAHFGRDQFGVFDGYASYVTKSSEGNCSFCHDPHGELVQQHTDWAESGHADVNSLVFREYDFGAGANGGCGLKCHTTTGYKAYLANPTATLTKFKTDASDKTLEVLRCDACHLDYSWELRPGGTDTSKDAARLPYPTFSATAIPAAGDSNICVNCHLGTKSGFQISSLTATAFTSSSNFGSFNPHYKGSAGTSYALNGYEFSGHADYVNAALPHPALGDTDRGSCVYCHMIGQSHTLAPVTYGSFTNLSTGRQKIDAALATFPAQPTCATASCHAFFKVLPDAAALQAYKTTYQTQLKAVKDAFVAYGIRYNAGSYPYFFDLATGGTLTNDKWIVKVPKADTTLTDLKHTQNVVGCAFNLSLLIKESGAYVHNPRYAKTLLYDSFDYLDDGLVNGSIRTAGANVTINAVAVANPFNGVVRP